MDRLLVNKYWYFFVLWKQTENNITKNNFRWELTFSSSDSLPLSDTTFSGTQWESSHACWLFSCARAALFCSVQMFFVQLCVSLIWLSTIPCCKNMFIYCATKCSLLSSWAEYIFKFLVRQLNRIRLTIFYHFIHSFWVLFLHPLCCCLR